MTIFPLQSWLQKDFNEQNDRLSDEWQLAGFDSNDTELNRKMIAEAESRYLQFRIASANRAKEFINGVNKFEDASIQRQLKLISVVGIRLDHNDSLAFSALKSEMTNLLHFARFRSRSISDCSRLS